MIRILFINDHIIFLCRAQDILEIFEKIKGICSCIMNFMNTEGGKLEAWALFHFGHHS